MDGVLLPSESPHPVPRLVSVLKMAAASVKKERKLPAVALDLLRLALQEGKFPRFWKDVVEQGLLKKQSWPARCAWCPSLPPPLLVGGAGSGPPVRQGGWTLTGSAVHPAATCVSACWAQPCPCCPQSSCPW